MSVFGIHHVALKCENLSEYRKALDFYQNTLGLAPAHAWGEGEGEAVMLDTGAGMIELFASGGKKGEGALCHIAFATRDTDACVRAVREAGYEVFIPAQNVDIASRPVYPVRIAFCHGPLGEEIEFFQAR